MAMWLGAMAAAMALYIAQLMVIMLMERRRQSHMAAWLLIAMVCPYVGFAAYWLVGRRPHAPVRSRQERLPFAEARISEIEEMEAPARPAEARLFHLLNELSPYPLTANNRTSILTDGEATFKAILEQLEQARHHIHLDYYTIRYDGIGRQFLKVLADKARKGVEVRVLCDGIGSMNLDKAFLEELRQAGGQACIFSAPRHAIFKRRLNYRNHRKIIVVDGKVGFLGGINIGDEYIGLDPKLGFWRDTHLQVKGDAVYLLQELFMQDWAAAMGETLDNLSTYMPPHRIADKEKVMIVPGNPGNRDQKIVEVLVSAVSAASRRVYAATPYFIPDPAMASSLRIAARSGIDVRLIIPGVSDSGLVLLATLSHVQDMLDAGVRIYRYQKGFIHSKVLIVDSSVASVGTANLDMRSFYSNYELLALLFDEKPIRRLEADYMNDLRHSVEIDPLQFARRPRKQKAAEAIMNMLSPLL